MELLACREVDTTRKVEFIPFLCLITVPGRSLAEFKCFLRVTAVVTGFEGSGRGLSQVDAAVPFPCPFHPNFHLRGVPEGFGVPWALGAFPADAADLCRAGLSIHHCFLGTRFRDGLFRVRFMVGLDNLKGLFPPK